MRTWRSAVKIVKVFYSLIARQARVGDSLYAELGKLAVKYPEYIQNLRGKGRG